MKYEKINTKSELGAEIHDFKIVNHYSSKFIKEIRNLWLEHSVLIFKNLQLNHYQEEKIDV